MAGKGKINVSFRYVYLVLPVAPYFYQTLVDSHSAQQSQRKRALLETVAKNFESHFGYASMWTRGYTFSEKVVSIVAKEVNTTAELT